MADPAAFAYINLSDSGTITASSELPLAPASRLQNVHIGRKWRSLGNSATLTFDLLSVVSLNLFYLSGLNLTAATGSTRLRMSATDPTGQDGAIYNGTTAVGRVDPAYGKFIVLLPAPVSARYLSVDLSDSSLTYIEGGRAVTALSTQVGTNFAPGTSDTLVDPAIKKKSRGGQTYIDPSSPDPYRVWEFSFEFLSKTERFDLIQEIERLCGSRTDVLLIRDPSSDNLGRDTIWGLMESTPTINRDGFIDDDNAYSKTVRIEQRL